MLKPQTKSYLIIFQDPNQRRHRSSLFHNPLHHQLLQTRTGDTLSSFASVQQDATLKMACLCRMFRAAKFVIPPKELSFIFFRSPPPGTVGKLTPSLIDWFVLRAIHLPVLMIAGPDLAGAMLENVYTTPCDRWKDICCP